MSTAAAEVGSTANSYQILAKLATGGMAEIFLARGEGVAGVERYCVLKRILRDRASDVLFVRMFLDEARLAAQLQHPNIAQVYDIGKLGDSYFFTMEYVHGETVRALLHRAQGLRRALPINCVLTIVAGAAAGLHHAHERVGVDGRALGIVHRDVSPSNLMVSYEGSVKLVDFGVAKASDRTHETKSGTVKGKISYLSPEQCRGKRVDRRSDLFSLGICFWEMLATERLYRRSSDFENMNAIVGEPPPPPSSRRADVPPEIDQMVLRLLAKEPDERFQTSEEVIEALEAIAGRTGAVLSPSGLGRFVRELFGQRPEPWLELESQPEPVEAVTVTSEPIPPELAIPPAARIDHQLASVIDLSSARSVTASLDPVVESTANLGKPAKRGFPLAAPPPTQPGTAEGSGPSAAVPLPARTTGPSPVPGRAPGPSPAAGEDVLTPSGELVLPPPPVPPSGPRPVLPLAAPPGPGSSGPHVPPGPLAPSSLSGSHVPPGPSSGPLAPSSAATSASFAAPLGSVVTPSGVLVTPSGPLAVLPGPEAPLHAAPRAAWPLYVVIAGAALLGSIAVMIMMRSRADTPAVDASAARAAEPPPPRPSYTVQPIDPPDVPAGPPGSSAPPSGPVADGSGEGDRGAPVAGAPPEADGRGAPRGSTAASKTARPASSRGTPAPHAPARRDAPPEDIPRLYAARHYDKVLAACVGPIAAEHAPMCFLAACQQHNEAAARRLSTAVPAARRAQAIADCAKLGVDLARVDCEADPMACQH